MQCDDEVLTVAAEYIASGLKCVPIKPGGKAPLNPGWSTKFLTIDEFRSYAQPGGGIGVVTGKASGIICIDIDKKSGGLAWLEKHKDSLGKCLLEQTPGGGFHVYFKYPENADHIPSTSRFAPGVEIMADGGRQVVTAPSAHPSGGKYKLWNNIPLTQIPFEADPPPDWILQELTSKLAQREVEAAPPASNGVVYQADIAKAVEVIKGLPGAIEGKLGDQRTFTAACYCKEYGLNKQEAFSVLSEYFNPRCKPPWTPAELRVKVNNAYQYSQNPLGAKLNGSGNGHQVEGLGQQVSEEIAIDYKPEQASDWLSRIEPDPVQVLSGIFDKGDKVVIIGKSKTRKSFFSQQLAFSLVSGKAFLGFNPLQKYKVLIVQCEIKKARYHARCLRMAQRLGIEPLELDQLFIVSARGCQDIPKLILGETTKLKPDVVIVDPFYKLLTGDENKAEDIKPILKTFDQLAESTGAAIVYIHHDKKGSAGDSELTDRGSGSGILARDFDSAIFLTAHESVNDGLVIEFITRNYQSPEPLVTEWQDYCFVTTDALAIKRTARSIAKGPKLRLDDYVQIGQKLCTKEYLLGARIMEVGTFNVKLKDASVHKDYLSAVKAQLCESQYITIEKHKRVKDAPGDTVTLLPKCGITQMSSKKTIEEFQDNDPLDEMPF